MQDMNTRRRFIRGSASAGIAAATLGAFAPAAPSVSDPAFGMPDL